MQTNDVMVEPRSEEMYNCPFDFSVLQDSISLDEIAIVFSSEIVTAFTFK